MPRRRLKDKGLVYIIIAIACLILLFLGYKIIHKNQPKGDIIENLERDSEVIRVCSEFEFNTIELKTDLTSISKEGRAFDSDNFFLKVLKESNSYMELAYEIGNDGVESVNLFTDLIKHVFKAFEPRSYLKSQFPVILNIMKSTEASSNNYFISYDFTTEDESKAGEMTPLLEEEKEREELNIDGNNVPILGEIIFVETDENEQYDTDVSFQSAELNIKEVKQMAKKLTAIKVNPNKPYVLIYHTHATESFLPITEDNYHSTKRDYNVLTIGELITNNLIEKGHNVKHIDIYHDLPSYGKSYTRSSGTVLHEMKNEKNIKILFDIHRDGIPLDSDWYEEYKKQSKVKINGKDVATFRFVLGPKNPNKEKVYEFARYIKKVSDRMYPGLCKGIIEKPYGKFNLYLSDYAALIEVGSNLNNAVEAKESAKYIADVLDKALDGFIE